MLEKDIERKVCKYAESKGWLQYKFSSPGHRNVPDRIFIDPRGKTYYVEFKRQGGRLTPGQKREIARIVRQGAHATVIYDVESGKEFINERTEEK
jgi:hypothetical protein